MNSVAAVHTAANNCRSIQRRLFQNAISYNNECKGFISYHRCFKLNSSNVERFVKKFRLNKDTFKRALRITDEELGLSVRSFLRFFGVEGNYQHGVDKAHDMEILIHRRHLLLLNFSARLFQKATTSFLAHFANPQICSIIFKILILIFFNKKADYIVVLYIYILYIFSFILRGA